MLQQALFWPLELRSSCMVPDAQWELGLVQSFVRFKIRWMRLYLIIPPLRLYLITRTGHRVITLDSLAPPAPYSLAPLDEGVDRGNGGSSSST